MTKKVIYIICTLTGAGVIAKGIVKAYRNYMRRIYREGFDDGVKAGKLEAKLDATVTKVEKLVDDLSKEVKHNKKKSIFSKKESA